MQQFKFNECGVCENPQVVYHFQISGDLAWRYVKISICEDENGRWDYGLRSLGYGSAACKNGRFSSRDEAIEAAIAELKKHFQRGSNTFGDHSKHKDHFYKWLASRCQLSLF